MDRHRNETGRNADEVFAEPKQEAAERSERPFLSLALLLFTSCVLGCHQDSSSSPAEQIQQFSSRGVFHEFRREGSVLVIDHEEMPGFMPAMIMPFRAGPSEKIPTLTPGDEITFDYFVAETSSWLENVHKTGKTRPLPEEGEASSSLPPSQRLAAGDLLPDYTLLDQDGQSVQLSDFAGGPVALTFIFTRCPMPEYCPNMMRKFQQVEEALRTDPSAPEQWKLLTLTFDPLFDTPDVMKSYGSAFGQNPENWTLLTAKTCCDIGELAERVGLLYTEKNGSLQHNLRTLLIDADRRISTIYTDETWSVADLVTSMKELGPPGASS
ncbi:MAG: SCO family protein [Verrucomicrobiota bacterium]